MMRYLPGLALLVAGCAANPRPLPPAPPAWNLPAAGPSEPGPDLSASPLRLEDILKVALEENAGLHAAERRWQAARARPGQATALPDPRLSLSYFVEQVATRNGDVQGGGRLQQTVPWPGKLILRGRIAEQEALAAWERYMGTGLDVIAEAKEAYYELAWIRESRAVTESNRAVVQRLRDAAQSKYAAGRTTQQDVLRAEMELSKLESERDTLLDLDRAAREQLNRTLNRAAGRPLGDPPALAAPPFERDLEPLVEEARNNRPRVREARRTVEQSETEEELAGLEVIPDVTFGVEYTLIDDTSLTGAPDPGDDAWGVTVGINLPLWAGRTSALKRERHERLAAARGALRQAEFDARRDVSRLHYRLRISEREIKLHEESLLPRARQALSVSETAYASVPSRVDFDTVIENQRRLLRFELALSRARADALRHRAHLERALGRPFEGGEK